MPAKETDLKQQLKEGRLARVYFLYGEESYLAARYAQMIADKAVGKDSFAEFNLRKFDGTDFSIEELEDAVEALPLMAERKCVMVRDLDIGASASTADRVQALLASPPEECVLVFWMDAVQPDMKKSARWKAFGAAVDKVGCVVEFPKKTAGDVAQMLCAGAQRRGSSMTPEVARLLVEQCGNDLNLLLNELDKLCALAGEGGVTREHVEQAATRSLETSVYQLTKELLQNHYQQVYEVLRRLFYQREKPVMILSVLSGCYVDLYRAKAAASAGVPAESLAAEFKYRGREFVLRNAARDSARLSLQTLRRCLDVLAEADTQLKSGRADEERGVLEKTVAKLIVLAKSGR